MKLSVLLITIFSIFFIFSCGSDDNSISNSEAIEMCKSMCDYNDCLASAGMTVSQCKSYCSSSLSTPTECESAVADHCSTQISEAYECVKNCYKQTTSCDSDMECENACEEENTAMDTCQANVIECQ